MRREREREREGEQQNLWRSTNLGEGRYRSTQNSRSSGEGVEEAGARLEKRRTRRSSRMKLRSSQKAIGQTTYLRIWPTNTEQRHRRAQARLRLVRASSPPPPNRSGYAHRAVGAQTQRERERGRSINRTLSLSNRRNIRFAASALFERRKTRLRRDGGGRIMNSKRWRKLGEDPLQVERKELGQ